MKRSWQLVKGLVVAGLLAAVLFFPGARGECYATLRYQELPLGFAGIKLPADVYVSYFDVLGLVDKYGSKHVSKSERRLLENLRIYQLAVDDGEHYRTAFLVSWSDYEKMPKEARLYLTEPISEEKKSEILGRQQEIRAYGAMMLQKSRAFWDDLRARKVMRKLEWENMGIPKLLAFELQDIKFATIEGNQAYNGDYRVLLDFNGVFLVNYGKGYLFNCNDRFAGIALFTVDSEREFWSKIFDYGVERMVFTGK